MGYGIVDTGFAWHDIISSFKSFSNCTRVSVYTRENYGGDTTTWWDPTGIGRIPAVAIYYVGNSFSDRIRSFHINRQD